MSSYVIGLTGGIACGKSNISRTLMENGVPVVDADRISREMTAPGGPALPQIRAAFGDGIFNGILHPMIFAEMRRQMDAVDGAVVLDVPLLFETGMEDWCDEIWCAYAPQKEQIRRLRKREGLTVRAALLRIHSQMPTMEKRRRADQVIRTAGTKVESGRITALVGLSGAGKSTIVNLLDKFYEPDCGSITLDGVDLKEWDTHYLRENIGLVLQKNHIFNGTIEENIRYGKPDASFAEVEEAARKASIYDQVVALPKGFESDATQLSGGQQQRIAIARMFLKNPPVIFLDEPTASLDAIATEQIKAAIDAIKKDRTVIIISHSIPQIIDSEMVYALQEGRVEQSGDPDSLYKKGGVYKDIVDASARSLNIEKLAQTIGPGGRKA